MVNVAVSVTVEWQVWCEPRESHVVALLVLIKENFSNGNCCQLITRTPSDWSMQHTKNLASHLRCTEVMLMSWFRPTGRSGYGWRETVVSTGPVSTTQCHVSILVFVFFTDICTFFVSTVWFSAFFLRQFLKTKATTMLEQVDWLTCSASSKKESHKYCTYEFVTLVSKI